MENAEESINGNTGMNDTSESSQSKFESEESNLIQEITQDTTQNDMSTDDLEDQTSTSSEENAILKRPESGDSSDKIQSSSSEIPQTLELKPETRKVSSEEEKKDETFVNPKPDETKTNVQTSDEQKTADTSSMPENEAKVSKAKLIRQSSSGDGNILPDYDKLIHMMKKASSKIGEEEEVKGQGISGTRYESEDTLIVTNTQSNDVEKEESLDRQVDNGVHKRIETPPVGDCSEIQINLSTADISEVNSCVSDENSDDQNMNQPVQKQEPTSISFKTKSRTHTETPQSYVSVGVLSAGQSVVQDPAEIPTKPVHPSTSFASIDQNGQILFMPNQPIMMPQIQAPLQVNYVHQPLGVPPSAFSQTPPIQQVSPAYNGTPMKKTMQYQTQPMKRKMKLRLVEERRIMHDDPEKKSLFSMIRQKSNSIGAENDELLSPDSKKFSLSMINHGLISVSWFEGTTTIELEEHVLKSIQRKLELGSKRIIKNVRLLDDSINPPEGKRLFSESNLSCLKLFVILHLTSLIVCLEIVLSPYIPDGSKYLLKFHIKDMRKSRFYPSSPFQHRAPDSPSKAPSPPLGGENAELEELHKQINDVLTSSKVLNKSPHGPDMPSLKVPDINNYSDTQRHVTDTNNNAPLSTPGRRERDRGNGDIQSKRGDMLNGGHDVLASRLEKLSDALLRVEDVPMWQRDADDYQPVAKRQVIFMIANYFVLFLSIIAISAEVHERAPRWLDWVNENINTVQNCAADRDALFECVSQGNFSGLVASIIIWASQSVATKRFFLFGFDSPKKLWTVVYEAGITSFCWGVSYMFIRRGLNPDNRPQFLQKYWKDAVYGSLAGFNAAFMKAVLKNLIPQDQMLDVLETRQIKILKFLGSAFKEKA